MSGEKQFSKYQWIEVATKKSTEPRKESFEVEADTLQIMSDPLPTKDAWKARKNLIQPLQTPSLLSSKDTKKTGDTLGFFKTKTIHKFDIEPDTPD